MTTALLFQGGVVILAVGLGWLFGLAWWRDMELSGPALAFSLAATLPLAASLLALPAARWQWASELTALVRRFLRILFHNAWPGAVVLVSILAGIGEELLFRGVIQAGLSEAWSPVIGILCASLLFGVAHTVTLSYFVLATLMGLYLGLLYHWTGNLLVPMIVHALYDWVAIHFYLRRS
ncbi:CPBP family intramembrane glutamic endopeptidase [Wenzhouxiangella sp. EGI_FJ10305]|uniref:CPBP family intramembrane glutamic endopeptidase n=1 Tax=Wenzhouxiangella sp. EGI_FJ10305 TaxID=3243768 RepID=UPI0035E0A781